MSPPSIPASRFEIVSPSPVPPNRRDIEPSACVNGWKSRASCSAVIPMPVSFTANAMRPARSSAETVTVTPPVCVNLIAFPTRFIRI